ncbi:MAG: site-specific DNA-methyltransferase [Rhizobacter sp.]|nr:site-specific DNA-methyltransferase [Chlorobiales bacterium]
MAAPQNRTLTLTASDQKKYSRRLFRLHQPASLPDILNRTIHQDLFQAIPFLPDAFVDLLFLDPPYNLTKTFGRTLFKSSSAQSYEAWLESWFPKLMRMLKPAASVYLCGDWRTSGALQRVAERYLTVRNRITWEREKGRGAQRNWKNASEDIWFCTAAEKFTFNASAVKLRRRVLAPYRSNGAPKDWSSTDAGNFRETFASNLWTDISVPFWSMPENTAHPTQKPEKLLAKLILASSNAGEVVFDPFLGSGTASVVAKKLGRHFVGIEQELPFACLAEKRLALAEGDKSIQGYTHDDTSGVFWERNSLSHRKKILRDAGL